MKWHWLVLAVVWVAGCDDGGDDGGAGGSVFLPEGGQGGVGGQGGAGGQGAVDGAGGGAPLGCELIFEGSTINDTCAGNQICLRPDGADQGDCVDALPRRWRFAVVSAQMPERRPDGECWDIGCGAPDPIIGLYINGQFVGDWGPHQDVFAVEAPSLDDSDLGEVNLVAGDELQFVLSDSDLSDDDAGLTCTMRAEADQLKARLAACDVDGFRLVLAFDTAR
jgi:hypothetical protein